MRKRNQLVSELLKITQRIETLAPELPEREAIKVKRELSKQDQRLLGGLSDTEAPNKKDFPEDTQSLDVCFFEKLKL